MTTAIERPFPEGWTVVVHVKGCKGAAFYLPARPVMKKTELLSEEARMPDGSPIEPGAMARCGSCDEPIELKELSVPPPRWKLGDPINIRTR